jgi:small subunit ribosomal protein S20
LPITKSAKEEMRKAQRRTVINKASRSKAKTMIVKTENLIAAGDVEGARATANAAMSALDKAAEKGTIHANNAARRKSRLMKRVNAASKPA